MIRRFLRWLEVRRRKRTWRKFTNATPYWEPSIPIDEWVNTEAEKREAKGEG